MTKAKLRTHLAKGLAPRSEREGSLRAMFMQLETVARRAHEFESSIHISITSAIRCCGVSAPRRSPPFMAGWICPSCLPCTDLYGDIPVVSISDSQRVPLPEANYVATVLHGLPQNLLAKGSGRGGYLAFLGRISPEKAPDAAIRIAARQACRSRSPPRWIESIGNTSRPPSSRCSRSAMSNSSARFARIRRRNFSGNAAGLLFPIAWREPFGLVMIEAMACGTPVIAMENGSVPEVLENGVTGFIVHSEQQAIEP